MKRTNVAALAIAVTAVLLASGCTGALSSLLGPGSVGPPIPGSAETTRQPGPGRPGTGVAGGGPDVGGGKNMNLEQATSDRAQLNTIAFDALGFLTGTLGSDSFFPPGKVADFWGFQYLRDNDPTGMGHNTDFLTSAALNMYSVLTTEQRARLVALAKSQVGSINEYGYKRFVLMEAFRRQLEGDLPSGSSGLNEASVRAYSAGLYELDGEISYERASVMGPILTSLSADQKAKLDAMVGAGMATWPRAQEPEDMRGLTRDEKVAVMTYAGDLFSWYAGDVEADTYFCPERHGTYFGSFYLKDAPAVGNAGYSIPTTMTGDMGENFIRALDTKQAATITGIVDGQRADLGGIVETRRAVSEQLRVFRSGKTPEKAKVLGLMKRYGDLDGALSYRYATAFSAVGKTLTAAQKQQLDAFRMQMIGSRSPSGAYLYSQEIPLPASANTDFLFGKN
jgi:hypothetical protein